MNSSSHQHRRLVTILVILSIVIVVALALMMCIKIFTANETEMRQSACLLKGQAQWCLVHGQDTVVVRQDTICQEGVWIREKAWTTKNDGKICTLYPSISSLEFEDAQTIIQLRDSVNAKLTRMLQEQDDFAYYMRTHGVQDEGYSRIADYQNHLQYQTKQTRILHQQIGQLMTRQHPTLICRMMLSATWYNHEGQECHLPCLPVIVKQTPQSPWLNYQVNPSATLEHTYAVSGWESWSHPDKGITVTISPHTHQPYRAILAQGSISSENSLGVPALFATDGSPVFSVHGQFIGIIKSHQLIPFHHEP